MRLLADTLRYDFCEPSRPNANYDAAVIVLANGPASPLQSHSPKQGENGPARNLAQRIAEATGALVCAYERPGSIDTRPRRAMRAALTPGFAFDHTVGQTARALSAAIRRRKPETTQILLAGHSIGANYSLALAGHTRPIQFPITEVSLANPLRDATTPGAKLWDLIGAPWLKNFMPLRGILTDAYYYARIIPQARKQLEDLAENRRDTAMYVNLALSLDDSAQAEAEALAKQLNQARRQPYSPKNRTCTAEMVYSTWFYTSEDITTDLIVRGFGGWSRKRPPPRLGGL